MTFAVFLRHRCFVALALLLLGQVVLAMSGGGVAPVASTSHVVMAEASPSFAIDIPSGDDLAADMADAAGHDHEAEDGAVLSVAQRDTMAWPDGNDDARGHRPSCLCDRRLATELRPPIASV